ncbi:MAG: TraB/GumN family protein [Bacteroidetes bacterium]|nr:TraB/GumN family protein [Bacteroidota bacterium]
MHNVPKSSILFSQQLNEIIEKVKSIALERILANDAKTLKQRYSTGVFGGNFIIKEDDFEISNYITQSQKNNLRKIIVNKIESYDSQFLDEQIPFYYIHYEIDKKIYENNFQEEEFYSYEDEFAKQASTKNKELKGLENVFGYLDTLREAYKFFPYKKQVEYLIEIVNNIDKYSECIINSFKEQIKGYKTRKLDTNSDDDLEYIVKKLNLKSINVEEAKKYDKNYYALMVDRRNKNWMSNIEKCIKEKSTLVAVGAAHLKGIIKELKTKGYKITPIKEKY